MELGVKCKYGVIQFQESWENKKSTLFVIKNNIHSGVWNHSSPYMH